MPMIDTNVAAYRARVKVTSTYHKDA